jgi:hypothetical protein
VSENEFRLPPGIGIVRFDDVEKFDGPNHMSGWNAAFQIALRDIGRAPGRYRVNVEFGATVEIENPGNVVEYIVTIT